MKFKRKCKICKRELKGRSDKIFCGIACKNYYHVHLRRVTRIATSQTDRILHRNRSILLEIMGKKATQKKVPRAWLDQKKFNFLHYTGRYVNTQHKTFYVVYDFSWMACSPHEVLIMSLRPKS